MSSLKDKIEAKRRALADRSAGYARAVKFPNGKSIIRVLPGIADANDFYEEIGIHWIKNAAGETVCAVGDREICFGEPCPVREAIDALRQHGQQTGDDATVKRAKDMLAKRRFFVNGVFLATPSGSDVKKGEACLIEFSETTFDQVLSIFQDYIEADKDPLALKEGITLSLERQGSGFDTKYTVSMSPKHIELKPEILGGRTDLAAFKRSQFDERARTAIAAISKELGRPLESDTINALMSAPAASKAIEGPKSSVKPAADPKEETTVDAEYEEAAPETPAPADDVDDIMAQLDAL